MIRSLVTTLFFLALFFAGAVARATSPLPPPPPSLIDGPRVAQPTSLRMERVRLSVAFSEGARDVVRFEVRYTVTNPSGAPEDVVAVFRRAHVEGMAVRVDGAPPPAMTAPPRPDVEQGADLTFRLVAAPGSRHEIVVSGSARGDPQFLDDGAVGARHMLVATRAPKVVVGYAFDNYLALSDRWHGSPPVEQVVTYPSGWAPPVVSPASWATRREGATTVLTRVTTVTEGRDLSLYVEVPLRWGGFRVGGPVLGIGGTTNGTKGVRGRLGFEVAAPSWLLYSLTADTDFAHRAIVTPMVEAASPVILIIPSVGLGVGMPVQVAPSVRPGARIQGDMQFYPVGLAVSGDVYPRVGSLGTTADLSVLAQFGF